MNKQIRRIAVSMVVMFLALAANLSYVQVVGADSITERAGNKRNLLREYSRERGHIVVADEAIASSVKTADVIAYLRQYAEGPKYAAATGYYSYIYGATGIERTTNNLLAGSDDSLLLDRITQLLAGRKPRGGAVVLTLDPRAQNAAWEGLNGRTGAVVALEPHTGRILALVSSPSFDPNLLTVHNANAIQAYYRQQMSDPAQPMLNRPLVRSYPPGSTFKLITAAAALENGLVTPDSLVAAPATFQLPGSTKKLRNWQRGKCAKSETITLTVALAVSCNTSFAILGDKVGADALRRQARNFGFDSSFHVPMTSAISRFPSNPDRAQTALSAIGQFDVQATALQMAVVTAAIADGGMVMNPYLVDRVLAPDLTILRQTTPTARNRAIKPETAAALAEMMEQVVSAGTGGNARMWGTAVAGKTGTAQTAQGSKPHAWFVGFAPAANPRVAVAVVIENGGGSSEVSGNKLAAPIAREVMKAVLK